MIEELVSVIIPVYNRENTINRAIDSVLSQTYSNMELIIVDDASTDCTVEKIHSCQDNRIRLICQKEHGGANKARNIGIANAKGDYIAFQDSDDEWLPDKLTMQINYMKKCASMVCYCAFYSYDGNEKKIIPLDYTNTEKYGKNLKETLKKENSVGTPTLVMHKSILDGMPEKGFDETLPRLQDYDFVIRLAQAASVAYIDTPLVRAYKSANSISQNDDSLIKAVAILLQKHKGYIDAKWLFSITLDYRTYHQSAVDILSDLDLSQKCISEDILDCRYELISCMIMQIRRQYKLLMTQYENVMEHITDRDFAIYGAGLVGKKIYQRLLNRNVHPSCFLVTEKGREEYIDDIPIISLNEYHDTRQMVIIGVDDELQNELVDNLVSRGVLSFCVYQREK